MASFVFKWAHPADEVYVTGTFDNWAKSEKLDKVASHFEKTVALPDTRDKIYYKFVVDGNWVTDHTAPKESDEKGNENNVLTPERIAQEAPPTTAMMNSAAPESTTAALAAAAPLEKKEENSALPGTFPETPAAEFGINPMPAADGAVNPIKLAPGEKVPEGLAAENTASNVKLDPESYEKADTLPGGAVPAAISSAAPESTTAALAAGAPIETKVPEVVKESQHKANFDAEASGIPEEVKEKAAVESELLDKVKEAPSTSEGTSGKGTEKTESAVTPGEAAASVAAAATAVGGAAIAGAVMAKDTAVAKASDAATSAQTTATEAATQLPESVKQKLPKSVQATIGNTSKEETREEVSPEVPTTVKQSITEAEKAPEAASNTEAVGDKKAMESELLKEVKPVEAAGGEATTAETKPEESVPLSATAKNLEETKPAEPTQNGAQPATDPTTPAKPIGGAVPESSSSSKPAESPATTDKEKKKKNRLSAYIGKVKSKLSSK
ncbi:hypothetical protein F5Y15DRAFT_418857 [Xylariaceae sp. FL0016]|nr:hypothetical protein F5Y15DRAFT_418857 [Xylariaceae sp. FL0016]